MIFLLETKIGLIYPSLQLFFDKTAIFHNTAILLYHKKEKKSIVLSRKRIAIL